jgi:hypothetical protein
MIVVSSTTEGTHQPVGDESKVLTEIDLSSYSPCLSTTVGEVTVKEEEGYLLPSLERLETSIEEDKTVGAESGNALAEPLPRVS